MAKKSKPAESAQPTEHPTSGEIRVRAKQLGFHGNVRRRPGAEFMIPDETFLGSWMERLDDADVNEAED